MTKGTPVLLRVGEETSYKVFKLDKDEVSLGNSNYATFTIPSQEISPSLISIRRRDDTWTITDVMSSNGIYVNGHHLVPLSPSPLQDGDLVEFGAPATPSGQGKFQYKFCCSFTVENALQSNQLEELEVQHKELKQQLRCQSLALETLLVDRQREKDSLMEEINESRQQTNEAKNQALEVKNGVLANFAEVMDVTVQCSICTEYIIQATMLNCSHVFCYQCIKEWMHIRKLCPNCRTPVTSVVRIPAMDKLIDRMIGQFGGDVRRRRQELINQRKNDGNGPGGVDPTILDALIAWLGASDIRVEIIATHLKAVATAAMAHARPANIRRTAALTGAEVMTQARALGRSETVRKAAVLTKKTVRKAAVLTKKTVRKAAVLTKKTVKKAADLTKKTVKTGAQALAKAKVLTTTKMLACSAVMRRAVLLTRAAAISKSKELTKSTIFRHAAALAKAAASTGATTLNKSTLLRRAVDIARASAHGSSEVLTKSVVAKKAIALTKAVAQTGAVRGAMVLSKAVVTRAAALKRAQTLKKLTGLMKAEACRRAADVKRRAALIKAYAAAGVATLKNTSTAFARAIADAQAELGPAGNARVTIAIRPGMNDQAF